MAVDLRSSSASGSDEVYGTSCTVPVPDGAASGDIALLAVELSEATNPTVTWPSGFTQTVNYAVGDQKLKVAWKRLTAADSGTYVPSWTGSQWNQGQCVLITGAITTGDPVETTNTATSTGSAVVTTSVTVATEAFLVHFVAKDINSIQSPPAGFVEVRDRIALGTSYRIPGASGTHTATGGTLQYSTLHLVALIAVKPQTASPAPTFTFPLTQLDLTAELLIDGAWVNITGDVRVSSGVQVGRGKPNETGQTPPSECSFVLNNRSGKYSPRNPLGDYYGKIGRNTQLRVTAEGSARFYGEVPAWPAYWDTSANDAWVTVTANGILRRINQGDQPATSSYRGYLLSTTPITYWPLTDGTTSTRGASAAGTYQVGGFGGVFGKAVYNFGIGDLGEYLPAGLRINDLVPAAGADFLQGFCLGSDPAPDSLAWEFVYKVAAGDDGSDMSAWTFRATVNGTTAGTFDRWELRFRPDGANDDIQIALTLDPLGDSPTDIVLADSAALTALTDGALHHVRMQVTVNGTGVDYVVYIDGVSVISGTRATHTLRAHYDISIFYNRLGVEDLLALGHLIVWENLANIPAIGSTSTSAAAYAGEAAHTRFARLCDEAGISRQVVGSESYAMGKQFEDYFANQLAEIEATDGGMLYEARDSMALIYATVAGLYNKATAVTLDYSAGHLAPGLSPVIDDLGVHNDVFAQRREGGSYQATLESGALSIQDPPDGVGRYKHEQQVNLETDALLPAVAGWLLHRGTVDEPRYPTVTVNLAQTAVSGHATLPFDLMDADVGDVLVITGADGLNIYDDVLLLILGYTETLEPHTWTIEYNCAAYSPFLVLEFDLTTSWLDPGDGTTLAEDLTTTETGMDVAVVGPLWATSGLPVSIMVGGEEMSVTAISGASSPQTFTVTRSVNSVVKTHLTGAAVQLKRPGILGL